MRRTSKFYWSNKKSRFRGTFIFIPVFGLPNIVLSAPHWSRLLFGGCLPRSSSSGCWVANGLVGFSDKDFVFSFRIEGHRILQIGHIILNDYPWSFGKNFAYLSKVKIMVEFDIDTFGVSSLNGHANSGCGQSKESSCMIFSVLSSVSALLWYNRLHRKTSHCGNAFLKIW